MGFKRRFKWKSKEKPSNLEEQTVGFGVIYAKDGIIDPEVDLEEISSDERKDKRFIGGGCGISVAHCIYLGAKYQGGNFQNEIKYYFINEEYDEHLEAMRLLQPNTIKVEFYGERFN